MQRFHPSGTLTHYRFGSLKNPYFIQSTVEVSNLFDRVKVHLYFDLDVFSIGEKFLAEPLSKVWPPAPPIGRAKDNLIGSTNLQVAG
jgi:hypothetical protein